MYNPENIKYISLMGSPAHTYGNALAMIQNWVLNLFPDNTFKTIHVSSKIAHRQITSTPHEFLKKTKPIIIFRPRISYDDDRFLANTLISTRMSDVYKSQGQTDLQPFFLDQKNGLEIKYTLNRYLMYCDVVMVFNTLMQQINYVHYLKNAVRIGIPFDIDTYLESFLSKDTMEIVSKISNVPMKDGLGSSKKFMDYLNSNSHYPITYKLQGSTNSEEYYRYYPAKVITTISDINADDGDRVGNVMNSYQISFSIKMEFWATGFYYLFSDKIDKIPKPKVPDDASIIPVFTDVFDYEDLNLTEGWRLFNRATCRLDSENDSVEIKSMLNESIIDVINYHKTHGISLVDLISIRVREQGRIIPYGEEYDVDIDNFKVNFHTKTFPFHTFTILICVNTGYINDMIKQIHNLE